jgi:hypothetical protein
MPDYTSDYPDMVEPAYISFDGKGGGEFAFGCVAGAVYGWPQLSDRNQDSGDQAKHYAQDHEVPKREPRTALCLFGKTESGLATS